MSMWPSILVALQVSLFPYFWFSVGRRVVWSRLSFVNVLIICPRVVNHCTTRTRVNQSWYSVPSGSLDNVPRAFYVDLIYRRLHTSIPSLPDGRHDARRMYNDIRMERRECLVYLLRWSNISMYSFDPILGFNCMIWHSFSASTSTTHKDASRISLEMGLRIADPTNPAPPVSNIWGAVEAIGIGWRCRS